MLFRSQATRQAQGKAEGREEVLAFAKKALAEATGIMKEARDAGRSDGRKANPYWKKAAQVLAGALDRLTPIADANPKDRAVEQLMEEMSMNLYSCNKYQTL